MGSLLGKAPKPAPLPKLKPPDPMPDPENIALKTKNRKDIAAKIAKSGRQSTLLSQGDNKLGGL
jgi:hypothetical protein